jgi:Tol biopolymer transport system component
MKVIGNSILLLFVSSTLFAQSNDTQYIKRISAFTWMPDGKAILLNIMKIDKSAKSPPVPTKYRFDINTNKIEPLPIDGGGLAAAPDGKSVAYIKRVNNNDKVYVYDFGTKQHKLLIDDTLRKYSVSWSPNGKNLIYTIQIGKGANAEAQICIFNILAKTVTQITKNGSYRSYSPAWNPKNDKIVYFLEKGDQHDQIYLTDAQGSKYTNLTNDTTTHNYSPTWLNENTIIFTQSPDYVMTMNIDGTNRLRVDGVRSTQFKFNSRSMKAAYLDNEGKLILFKWANKTTKVLIDEAYLSNLQ